MSITRAQQAKQMLQNGGRIGLQGGGADMGASERAQERADRGYGDTSGPDRSAVGAGSEFAKNRARAALEEQRKRAIAEISPSTKFRNRLISGIISSYIPFGGKIYSNMIDQRAMGFSPPKREIVETITDKDNDDSDQVMAQLFTPYQKDFIEDKAEELNPIELAIQQRDQTGGPRLFAADGGRMGLQEGGGIEQRLEQLGGDVTSAEQMLQGINQRLKTAESSLGSGGRGPGGLGTLATLAGSNQPFMGNMLPSNADPQTEKLTPLGNNFPGLGIFPPTADQLQVGEMGQIPEQFREGYAEYMKGKPMPMGGQAVSYVTLPGGGTVAFGDTGSAGSFRDYLKSTGFTPPSPLGQPLQLSLQQDPYARTLLSGLSQDGQRFDSAQSAFDALAEQTRKAREINPFTRDVIGTELFQGAEGFKNFTNMFNQINDPNYVAPSLQLLSAQGSSGIPAVGFADGGNAALAASAFVPFGEKGSLFKRFMGTPVGEGVGDFFSNMDTGDKLALAASGALVAAPFVFGEDDTEDEYQKFLAQRGGQGFDIPGMRAKPYDTLARAFVAEGGKPEPVAKKTMPLLDMGGKEMDLREEGGFVPIGRMEKADDVPARLSKNEFVFTADAVRNAGDGNVDKGAEVMYNMMKNLEAGGEVSEESQGLDGARKMFQTSQRLEEVL